MFRSSLDNSACVYNGMIEEWEANRGSADRQDLNIRTKATYIFDPPKQYRDQNRFRRRTWVSI